ncbi:MAG: hypothetical protein ACLR1T_05640 [Evtepia gabavorous]
MKITLLEPLGIPEEVLARYQSRLEKRGHQFTAYGEKTTDPAELIRRTGESEIVILANNPILRKWWRLRQTLKCWMWRLQGLTMWPWMPASERA